MQILNSQETFVLQKSLFLRFDLLFLAKVSKVSCLAHQNCCKDPIQSFGWVKKWFWAFLNKIIFGLMTSSAGSLTSDKIALFGTFSLLICKPLKVATLCFQQNVEKDLLYAVKKPLHPILIESTQILTFPKTIESWIWSKIAIFGIFALLIT